ncbi:hypothetical protein ACB092_05G034900, partial [Castanea dentata]
MITLSRLKEKDPHFLYKISLNTFDETPLHISASIGHLEFSKTLLLLKPQLAYERDFHGRYPLHLASAEGHIEIVKELLHANKDACTIHDQDRRIPLHYAAMRGRVEVVRELIIACPNSTQVMLDGRESVLHLCIKYNQLETLKLLVEFVSDKGDFLNSKDHYNGNTILHLAVMLKQIETVKYLLTVSLVKEGAYALNRAGFTASESLEHNPRDFKSFTIQNILMDAGLGRGNEQNNLSPSLEVVVGHHELPKPVLPSKKKRKWLEYLRYQGNWIEEIRGSLMVVATVITAITFQPAVSPPGGVWQTNVTEVSKGFGCGPSNVCLAGTSVEGSRNSNFFYHFFMFCNTLSFTASLFVIFLSISGFSLKNKFGMGFLTFAIWTTITSLALAYMSAVILVLPSKSSRALRLYEVFMTVWSLIIMMVVVLLIHIIRFLSCLVKKIRKLIIQKQR